jgi:hypothetical protein
MRAKRAAFTVIAGLILIGSVSSAFGQKEVRLNATPAAFQKFYAKFVTAMKSGDKQSVAALSQFPFKYGLDAGDEGFWSRAQFLRLFDRHFKPRPKFLSLKNPVLNFDNGTYSVANEDDASYFIFRKRGGTYKFASYMVEP